MRYKKHMIILLAAIFLFAMATASAADLNDTAVAVDDGQLTDEIIQASENQENTIQASNNDEVNLSEDDSGKLAIGNDKTLGTGTDYPFIDIQNAINGGESTIYLKPGTYTGDNVISISQKSNIKIIGDSTILDAQCQTQIFDISQSSNITIQNIIFKNGYAGRDNGGAIKVFNFCRDCSIYNCTFINNYVGGHGYGGGAIYGLNMENGWISNCTFINNYAAGDGGAIRLIDSWWRVNNCTFINNHAYWDGGAIYGYTSFGEVRVNNCTFINNTAEGDGDAIGAENLNLNADYNWFGNTADNYNDPLPIYGDFMCDYRLFLNATANPDTIAESDTSNITFKLYQYHSGVVSDYDNAPFKNLDLTITATKGNAAGTAKLGEPIQFTPTGKGTTSITATVETVRQTAEINVLKGDFDLLQDLVNNESLSLINLERNYTYNEFDTITEGVNITRPITINGNGFTIDAKGKSRIFYVTAGSINITDVTLKNGKADSGGAIFISHEIDESNINATFINNTAEENGGAIYIVSGGISGNVNGVFINNTVSYRGGAIYIGGDGISGNVNGTFSNNKASNGSAIFVAGDVNGNIDGTFINNEATAYGTVYIGNGDVKGNVNGTFINNIANQGGAIAVGLDGSVSGNIKGTFINNTGYYSGGAICIANCEKYPTGNFGGIFINNKAESGGAIYIEFTYEKTVSFDGIFINNRASIGGAILINQMFVDINIKDSIFLNNSDALSFRVSDCNIKTTDCWFGNNATNYNSRPDAGKAVMDRWLFLNATANTTDVSIDENSIIAFKLDSYDNSSGKVKPYDASKMNIILDLTQTLGDLDKTAASIDENITYTARQGGNSAVTGKYETASYTIELNNVKLPTEINVTNSTIALKANEEVDAGATLTPADAGNLTYTSNNTNVVIVENGKIKSIKKGNATITVSFAGDGRYAPADNKTISVIVNLNDAGVKAEDMELKVGESGVINYTAAPEGLKVNFVADNSGIVSVDEDGTVKALKNGAASITLNVGDEEVYAKNSTVITVTVTLNDACVVAEDMELNVSDLGVIKYTTDPNGLNVTFVADNSGIVGVDEDGNVKALKEGKANITVKVGDDKVYAKNSTVITITVSKIPTKINVNNHTLDLHVDDKADSVAELLPSDVGKLNFTSSDENVVVVDANGTFTAIGAGSANVTVSFKGNDKYAAAESKIIYVTVSKIPTRIFVSNGTIDMGVDDEVDPGVSITPSDAGKLNFTSSDVSIVRVDGNGTFIGVGGGNAIVTVSFNGNDKFEAAESKNITVTVTKIPTEIVVVNSTVDMKVDDIFDPVVSLMPSDAGRLSFRSSNDTVVLINGHGMIKAVGEGNAIVTVVFDGNEKYAAVSRNITVSVTKIPTEITLTNETLDLKVNDMVDGLANLTPGDAGNLTFISSDEEVVFVADGMILAYGKGTTTVTVSFAGNDKYAAAENKTITVNVSLRDASVSVENSTLDLKVDDRFDLNATTVPDWLNVEYVSSDESVATVTDYGIVTAVGEGTAIITVEVGDDEIYAKNSTTVTVTVSKIPAEIIIQNTTVDMVVDDIFDPVVSLMPSNAGRLSFRSSNDTVVLINGHGMIKAVGEGNATVTVAFDGNEKYAAVSRNITVSVSKQDTNINVSMPENITVGDNSTVNVVLPDDATGNVTVNVDGEVIDTVAVTDGTADVTIPSLSAGNHTVEIAYLGDDKYNSASKIATITVNKYSTNITSADVSATYKVNKYLVINLTDSRGNPLANSTVTVELSTAKNYTSDENGQIKVKVSSLVPKTYTAKITFKGDEKYAGSNTTAEVTVKKATAKITAKAKTFKTTTKTKKYTVTLKANGKALKNKWVYLKVNGKKYKAKTNSKGKATFKITQLNKAGKYKATVTFKGNDYYKKATKKATIKVKSAWKTVQKGSKNSAIVKKIQRALKNHGYYLEYNGRYLKVDGIFWDYTEMAVKEFQNDKTLKVTGKVDEKTAKKLGII